MSDNGQPDRHGAGEARCANCGTRLDANDKFCRECGLPTPRLAQAQRVPVEPPDTQELKRALDVAPDPKPFARMEPVPEPVPGGEASQELTTGSVVRVTSPTFAAQMAASTAVMVVLLLVLALAGIVLLVLAFRA